jgi:hypothetical protein
MVQAAVIAGGARLADGRYPGRRRRDGSNLDGHLDPGTCPGAPDHRQAGVRTLDAANARLDERLALGSRHWLMSTASCGMNAP